MLWISKYGYDEYYDGSIVAVCLTSVDTFWPAFYFVGSISVFFILPLLILLVLYTVIAQHLMNNPGLTSHGNRSNVLKYRKQVMFMLGAVVLSFFICLLPFRALTLWIIVVPPETILQLGINGYYSLVYFCRIMLYINSALNPILYNLMSSKFREGFLRLLGCKSAVRHTLMSSTRKGTFHTTSTNLSSSQSGDKRRSGRIKEDADTITGSIIIRNGAEEVLIINDSEKIEKVSKIEVSEASKKINGFAKRKRSTFEDIEELEEHSPRTVRKHEPSIVSNDNVKDVLFCQPNGTNGCTSTNRKCSAIDINSKTKLLTVLVNKTDSIDSANRNRKYKDDTEYSNNGVRIHYTDDDSDVNTFLQNAIGTESFV